MLNRIDVHNDPVSWVDSTGLFGDGIMGGGQIPGHSDFYGGNSWEYGGKPFDFTRQDHGRSSPFNPFSMNTHFKNLSWVETKLKTAVMKCDREWFERYLHMGQDYYSHYSKGFRWYTLGHLFAGTTPDDDMKAWYKANEWTKRWIDRWDKHCECPIEKK